LESETLKLVKFSIASVKLLNGFPSVHVPKPVTIHVSAVPPGNLPPCPRNRTDKGLVRAANRRPRVDYELYLFRRHDYFLKFAMDQITSAEPAQNEAGGSVDEYTAVASAVSTIDVGFAYR